MQTSLLLIPTKSGPTWRWSQPPPHTLYWYGVYKLKKNYYKSCLVHNETTEHNIDDCGVVVDCALYLASLSSFCFSFPCSLLGAILVCFIGVINIAILCIFNTTTCFLASKIGVTIFEAMKEVTEVPPPVSWHYLESMLVPLKCYSSLVFTG